MNPIYVPGIAELVTSGLILLACGLLLLGIVALADWVLDMKRQMEAEHEEQAQSTPSDPAQLDAPWGMDDRVVRRRKNRDRELI